MQEILLEKIAELEAELDEMYEELDASDYTHYGRHLLLTSKLLKKSEELASLKNGLELTAAL